ncbi:MAG: UDP-N-acetylmuramate dehydrogenase [Proteobacteria bacterium]|nr:UDP-N-acetylmuramate dehydrogenase [Pseudomonadota bacterium]
MKPDTLNESDYRVTELADLSRRNSFRVPARAQWLIEVGDAGALPEVFGLGAVRRSPLLVLGEGSNVLLTRDWPGAVLSIVARGIRILDARGDNTRVRVEAGENWNDFVHWSLGQGFAGLENLALIPGSVGAAPIQNIGAYGVEVREFIETVEAFDRRTGQVVRLDNAACGFAYRDSLFKRDADRYLVCAVEFLLPRRRELRLDYAGMREELAAMKIDTPNHATVAEAVMRLRTRKLPNPAQIGNAGSFFKNPLVSAAQADTLRSANPALPVWPGDDGQCKLSAAWLVEACGFKGVREGDAGVSERHALVLVNHGAATGAQLWALAQRIIEAVYVRFEVRLEPEPRIA